MDLRSIITSTACLVLLSVAICSCGGDQERPENRRIYSDLVSEAMNIYSELHPLRSSRLGLYESDSLLFTFSHDEINVSIRRLKTLLDDLSRLPVAGLEERLIDNYSLLLNWLKGELYALENIQSYKRNPILYCWMVEEALFGICSRIQPPYDGELAAYEKRLSLIPELLTNAASLLRNPAELHVNLAIERLDGLLTEFDILRESIGERYSEQPAALETARRSIEGFRQFIKQDLSSQTRGSLILGLENLSKIFLYDELLELDPNRVTEEAMRSIDRLKREVGSLKRSETAVSSMKRNGHIESEQPEKAIGSSAESGSTGTHYGELAVAKEEDLRSTVLQLIGEIDENILGQKAFDGKPAEKPEVIFRRTPCYLGEIPDNPYLTIPPLEEGVPVLSVTPPFSGLPDHSYVVIPTGSQEPKESELLYLLLKASSPVRMIRLRPSEESDTVRALIPGETHREGWVLYNMDDLTEIHSKVMPELKPLLLEEKIRALARTVIVFRLHAGTFTSEGVLEFLAGSIGLTPEEARFDLSLASVSPSIAYAGIALILNEEIIKRSSKARGVRKPRAEVRRILDEYHNIPLSIIMRKLPIEK